jgi:hypothetical protein
MHSILDYSTHFLLQLTNQSQSYGMIDSQLATLSWCQAPIWGPRPTFYYC